MKSILGEIWHPDSNFIGGDMVPWRQNLEYWGRYGSLNTKYWGKYGPLKRGRYEPWRRGRYETTPATKRISAKLNICISGRPNSANMTSPSLSYHSDHYNITWAINSFSPIEQYRISYRKVIVSISIIFDPDWCSLTTFVHGGRKVDETSAAAWENGRRRGFKGETFLSWGLWKEAIN